MTSKYQVEVRTPVETYEIITANDYKTADVYMKGTISDIQAGEFILIRRVVDEAGIARRKVNPRLIESVSIREVIE